MITSDNIKNIMALMAEINPKLKKDFGINLTIEGFVSYRDSVNGVTDVDADELQNICKSSMLWHIYLTDISGLIDVAIGKYQLVLDVYRYLDSIAVKDPDAFQIEAPKYRIDSRNIPIAIQVLEGKIEDVEELLKALKIVSSAMKTYAEYADDYSKKIAATIYAYNSRMQNNSF